MPRKPFIPQTRFPYHVTNRCNNREWFDLPLPFVWKIFCEQIPESADRFSVVIHSFVLMSNHFHLLALTPLGNLDRFLRHLLTEVARALKRDANRINHVFGARTSQSILDNAYSLAYVYKYVYRNPVRASLIERVEDYRFSTLSELLAGRSNIAVAEGFDLLWSLVPKEIQRRLDWLNLPTSKEQEALISKGLRRSSFQFSKSNSTRKELDGLVSSYGVSSQYDPYLLGPKGE